MAERKFISHKRILAYWQDKCITELGEVINDSGEYDNSIVPVVEFPTEPCCWGCGCLVPGLDESKDPYGDKITKSMLQRCHIVPHALGGSDTDPANLFLLCGECHKQSPDTSNPRNFLMWVYQRRKRMIGLDLWNHDVRKLMDDVVALCEKLGKDPRSGDINAMALMNHGSQISDSSFVYAYVDTCKPLSIDS